MAYQYGVNLKLDSEKAVKDIDSLLAKLKQMETLAGKIKLKVSATNDIEKQQQAFLKSINKMKSEEQKLTTQRKLNEEKVAQAQNKTATQQRLNAQKVAQEEQKTANQRIKDTQKIAQEEDKLATQQRINAQKVAQEEEKTAQKRIQTAQKVARAEQQAASSATGKTSNSLTTMGGIFTNLGRLGYNVTNSLREVQNTASSFVNNMFSYAKQVGSQILSQVENIASSALEQYETLETAQIGFSNFFEGNASEFVKTLRKHAEDMPGVSAQDLVRGVQYIAPQAKGNSSLALAGAEGVMKAILYSGNDPSQWGTNALQNIQQISSGAFTYQDIKQMLRAMPTITKLLAETERGQQLLDKGGAITTDKMKAFVKKYGESALLELFAEIGEKSSAANIYERYAETFAGVREHIVEVTKNAWNDAMEDNGVYKTIQKYITKIGDSGLIKKFFDKIGEAIGGFFDWVEKNESKLTEIAKTAGGFLKEIGNTVGEVVRDLAEHLGLLNKDGSLNTKGIKDLMKKVTDFIKGIIKGFGEGLKTLGDIIKWVAEHLGEDGWERLGHILGLIASPLGKVVIMFGSLFSALMQIGGNAMTLFGGKLGGAKVATEAGAMATGMKKATSAIGMFASKVMSGLATGGVIWMISEAAGGLVKSLNLFGNKSEEVGDTVESVGTTIAFTVAGAKIAGVAGGVIGCLIGLGKAAVEAAEKLNKHIDEDIDETAKKRDEKTYDYIIQMLKNKGVNVDTGTEEGFYASEKLKQAIKEANGDIDPQELANKFADALNFKKSAEGIVALTGSDEFKNAGGTALDLDKDTAKRDEIADMVKWYRLLGDSYNYDVANEKVVKDYLKSGGYSTITDKQYEMLMGGKQEIETAMSNETIKLAENITATEENTTLMGELKGVIETANGHIKNFNDNYKIDTSNPLSTAAGYANTLGYAFGLNGKYKTIQDAASGQKIGDYEVSRSDIEDFIRGKATGEAEGGNKELAAELLVLLYQLGEQNSGTGASTGTYLEDFNKYSWFYEEFLEYLKQHKKKSMGGLITPIYRASGGLSRGVDTIPAMLAPGEYDVKSSADSKAGVGVLDALNHGDLGGAARAIGSKFTNSWDNSRSYSRVINNNQKTITNRIGIVNKTRGGALNSYYSFANRMAASF